MKQKRWGEQINLFPHHTFLNNDIIKRVNIIMKKIQDLFIKLVKINSPFGQEKELTDFVIKKLKKLNLVIKRDKFGNVIARSRKFNKKDSILICAHLDTTESNKGIKPKIKKGVIYSGGKYILGADNKAAIAEIIHALQTTENFRNVELLFTVQEENGLMGSKNLDRKLIKSRKALVLDRSLPPGCIVLKTPSAVIIDIKILGKAIHGSMSDLKYNAISVSGACVSSITNNIDSSINCNMGMISGGTAVNTSPSIVNLSLGLRSFSDKKLNDFIKKNRKDLGKITSKRNCRILIKETKVGSGYLYDKNDKFVKELIKRFKEIKIKSKLESSKGLSDANILNKYGIKTIEIGYGPQNTHTHKEFVVIKDMEKMSEFLSVFFKGA